MGEAYSICGLTRSDHDLRRVNDGLDITEVELVTRAETHLSNPELARRLDDIVCRLRISRKGQVVWYDHILRPECISSEGHTRDTARCAHPRISRKVNDHRRTPQIPPVLPVPPIILLPILPHVEQRRQSIEYLTGICEIAFERVHGDGFVREIDEVEIEYLVSLGD